MIKYKAKLFMADHLLLESKEGDLASACTLYAASVNDPDLQEYKEEISIILNSMEDGSFESSIDSSDDEDDLLVPEELILDAELAEEED